MTKAPRHVARSTVSTERASIYLQQLCKHFAHKVPVDFTPEQGRAELPGGVLELQADGSRLLVEVNGEDADGLARACGIVEDHLCRFAHREGLGPLNWSQT